MQRSDVPMPPTYSTGWIYILQNDAMPGLLKIGFTRKTVERRAVELSSHTGVPSPFICIFYCQSRDPENVEKAVHLALAGYKAAKEFFRVNLDLAVEVIRLEARRRGGPHDEWFQLERTGKSLHLTELTSSVLLEVPSHKQDVGQAETGALCNVTACAEAPFEAYVSPGAMPSQLTLEAAHTGKVSVSLTWVPLKGHQNERQTR